MSRPALQRFALVILWSVCCMSSPVRAQAPHHPPAVDSGGMSNPAALELLALQSSRMGSGTTWLPEASRMRGFHLTARSWQVMLDGSAFVQYVRQFGTRQQWQLGSTNWLMGMADRRMAGGSIQLRAMLSAEPATLTAMGYPLLLQVAEPYRGGTVTDRQHPHELLSELAIRYGRPINPDVAAELYIAPAGEPALGPVAYRHRPSAANDPAAPLGHHAQDAAHTTFGVVTVGVFTRSAKLEASVFNGHHPDDARTGLDLGDARLDSYAGRLTFNPSKAWSVSGSAGYIRAGNEAEHGGDVHESHYRMTVSVLHTRPVARHGEWSSAVLYGVNMRAGGVDPLYAVLLETNVELGQQSVFGRAEYVRRSAAELALTGSVRPELTVRALSLGFARAIGTLDKLSVGAGARGTANFIPADLEPFYGSRTPLGVFLYLRVRPNAVAPSHTEAGVR